jgi:hypothetical protein
VEPAAIIEGFDVFKDGSSGVMDRVEDGGADALSFEGAPEGFHGSVIIAVSSGAHALAELEEG